jgi:hypothetical protein
MSFLYAVSLPERISDYMIRAFFSFAFLFTLFPLADAQLSDIPGTLRWGAELREPAGGSIEKIIDTGPFGFYALRRKGSSSLSNEQIFIELYDNNMKLKKSQKLEMKYQGKRRDFEDIAKVGGQLYLLTSFHNQVKKKNYLFYQKLSDRLTPSRDLVKIGEIDTHNKARVGIFDLSISKDSSKVLIYSQLPYKKNEPERFALQVFDNGFNPLWNSDIVLPYPDTQFSVEEYRIDNEGNVYLLGVMYRDKVRTRRMGMPNYQYVILVYTPGRKEAQEYRVELGDKFITDLTFRIADDGNLVFSGFYSERGTYSVKGTYFFRLDPKTREVFNRNLRQFDFEFLTEFMSDGRRERERQREEAGRGPELYQFSLDELILRSDGGVVLVAEQYYVFERTYRYWDGSIRFDYFYNYNDIIVVNIRPDGEIEWTMRIPKRQETLNDGGYYSSYAMSIVRDRLYFIYNDNGRNFEEGGSSRRLHNFNGRYSVIAMTELRKDGSATTYPLFQNLDAGILTRPKVCRQSGSRRMIVYGERGRFYRFADLEFQ